jgi:hypothetical protein
VECFDSFEVFSALYRGMLLHRDVFCPLSFEVLAFCGRVPEPHVHEVDQSLAHLLSFNPHAPSLEKRRGGEHRTTLVERVLTFSGELLVGNSSGSLCSIQ